MATELLWTPERKPIVIVGPTAVGKTEVALLLAERIGGEIVNADSVQVYRHLDIGSAKPDREARARIPFHLLDIVNPDETFTVSDWKRLAEAAIEDIFQRGKHPIICGGTGLYVRALLDDWSLAATPADPVIRRELEAAKQAQGVESLYARLQEVDASTAARLHPNDAMRIIRALEVYLVTNTPLSVYQAEDRRSRPSRSAHRYSLTLPREALYARIDNRVDRMLEAGFVSEVRQLLSRGYSPRLSAMKTLGYKEMSAYLSGALEYEAAVSEIKQNTRRFAKRQLTWFRADKLLHWIDVAGLTAFETTTLIQTQLPKSDA